LSCSACGALTLEAISRRQKPDVVISAFQEDYTVAHPTASADDIIAAVIGIQQVMEDVEDRLGPRS